jgi:ribosomal protein S18 acetylase RimI-like enzyme
VAEFSEFLAVTGQFRAPVSVRQFSIPETPFSYADDLVYLHHISVRPSYRRQGVGRALMDAVRSAASERGITVFAEPA